MRHEQGRAVKIKVKFLSVLSSIKQATLTVKAAIQYLVQPPVIAVATVDNHPQYEAYM
jgi:hypothetical protein